MRWFLTDNAPELEAALGAAGEEIVSGPQHAAHQWVQDAMFHPTSYPLAEFAIGAKAEVVVLVDPIRLVKFGEVFAEFGYARGHGKTLRNRKVTLAMFAHDNPLTLDRYKMGMYRRCACEVNDVAVHIVQTSEIADRIRGSRRVAVWAPGQGAEGVIAAVQHARSGKTYSPKMQGREWG